jgi:hypothetical protein
VGKSPDNRKRKPVIAFGPEVPGWGSWDWCGRDIQIELARYYSTLSFASAPIPDCDVLFVIKHALSLELIAQAAQRAQVVYCPVDYYGNAADIDADAAMLRKCSRILIHSHGLRKYFEPYAPVEYIDHHVKFVSPMRTSFLPKGFILWVGVRTNLPPLIAWINTHSLPCELRILTNLENPKDVPTAEDLGIRNAAPVVIENWSAERHVELLTKAKAALDIKDTDFRARHKSPAKAIDFIASGLPLAMNEDSCVVEHLARMGFEIASPLETERWFSKDYWEETQRFGRALRELLSLRRIGLRYKQVVDALLKSR